MKNRANLIHRRLNSINKKIYLSKPGLRSSYLRFYRIIKKYIYTSHYGKIIEFGSGFGAIREIIPHVHTTDLFCFPEVKEIQNIYSIKKNNNSYNICILFDVLHHLEHPYLAFQELHRILKKHGKIIIIEPAMSWFGIIIYGLFHHEPLGFWHKINPPGLKINIKENQYYAAQALAYRLFIWKKNQFIQKLFTIQKIHYISCFEYFLSGGFSGPSLMPRFSLRLGRWFDKMLSKCPPMLAGRVLICLEKK